MMKHRKRYMINQLVYPWNLIFIVEIIPSGNDYITWLTGKIPHVFRGKIHVISTWTFSIVILTNYQRLEIITSFEMSEMILPGSSFGIPSGIHGMLENGPFMDGFPIKTPFTRDFPACDV